MASNKNTIDREMYAYTALLRQLSAKYNTSELKTLIKELDDLNSEISQDNHLEYNEEEVDKLRLIVINLQIQIIHCDYADLKPVCLYLSELLDDIRSNLQLV